MRQRRFERIVSTLKQRQPDLTVVMDAVHKTHNLSAVTRTCDAVGIPEVHAVASEDILHLKRNVAGGCQKWVKVTPHQNIRDSLQYLRARNFRIFATSAGAGHPDFREADYTRPTAIVLGNELDGLSTEVIASAEHCLSIPLHGMVAALNVSVAAGIILFEAEQQRRRAGMYQKQRLDDATFRKLLFEWAYPRVSELYRKQGRAYPEIDGNGNFDEAALVAR